MADRNDTTIRLPVRFVEELSRATTIEQVLAVAAMWIPRLVDADRARLTFQDDDKTISHTFRRDAAHDPRDDLAPVRPGSAHSRVLQGGVPLQLNATDMARDPDQSMQRLYDQGIRQSLHVPMKSGDATVGVIGLARRAPVPFTWLQIRQLGAAGDWIAAQARLMQQLRANTRLAETDALTGLANRARLMRVLNGPAALHEPDSRGRVIGVIHVDLDNFKEINDRMGHAAGDKILRHTAAVMQQTVGPSDLVARTGGDEFVIATRSDSQGRSIARLAARLAAGLAVPLRIDGMDVVSSASIGTALAGPEDRSADRLIANADIALYEVKRRGRGSVCAFTEDMRIRVEDRRRLFAELQHAIDTEGFEPYFQPVVELATGRVVAFELLARWPHPDRGLLAPTDFIEAAHESGIAARIDAIVRDKGLDRLRDLRAAGAEVPVLSFNASGESLSDPDLPEALLWEVLGKSLNPADLAVEVAEADLVADTEGRAERNVALMADLGFSVLIDDFGTGHASMPQIRQLKVSGLKLGPALTSQLTDQCSEQILRAILAMSRELGLTVAAKAIESTVDLDRLRALKCDQAQGYGISAPLDGDSILPFLAARAARAVRLVG